MDIELQNTTVHQGQNEGKQPFELQKGDAPARSSLRLHYEAQAQVIRKQIGDLESVRLNLGLSARKICQLLLVDPSAWTRWTRPGGDAPPHVYRSLQWYLTIQEKIPGLTADYFIGRNIAVENQSLKRDFERKYEALEKGQLLWSESQRRELQSLGVLLEASVQRERDLQQKVGDLETKTQRMFIATLGLLILLSAFVLVFVFRMVR